MKWLLRTLLAILLGLAVAPVGAALGWYVGLAWVTGALTLWQRLPALPAKALAIRGGSTDVVLVEASDGQTYRCARFTSDWCWTPASGEETLLVESPECTGTGDFDWYANVSAPPSGTVDSLKTRWCLPSLALAEVDYAVTQDGSVWYWAQVDGEMMPYFRVFAPVLAGIVLGFLVGVGGAMILFRRHDRQLAGGPAPNSPR